MATQDPTYDRTAELKAFDETKTGVKGLLDRGLTTIPRIFHVDPSLCPSIPTSTPGAQSIPTIDLRRPVAEVVEEIRGAASEWGFFQVVNHGVPAEAMDGVMEGVVGFFEGDVEVKKGYYSRDMERKVRYNCNFDLFRSRVANWRDTLGVLFGPDTPELDQIPESCRETTITYWKHVARLGELLLELLSRALGLDPLFLKEMGCSKGQLLLLHYYPSCPQPELAIGTSPHSDLGLLTILLQDQSGGLQVLHNNQWVDVPPSPSALVVNIGDFLQLISNDRFISVEHRVLANKTGPRISAAFFLTTLSGSSSDDVYGPIEELLSEDNPPLYRGVRIRDYVSQYYAKGLDRKSALSYFRL